MVDLGFDEALTALMPLLDHEVELVVGAIGADDDEAPIVVEGTLTAGWDPDVMEAEGLDELVIFRIADSHVRMVLSRAAFGGAESLENGTVRIRTAGVEVSIAPAGRPEHAELQGSAD